ncbi:MAG: efflux RND transporter periplasmic adaptor subunit [Pedobacter sp.]|nr:MAG: efflux RND transporter periplasmic adaptor subunit [Pedobacter sp.]
MKEYKHIATSFVILGTVLLYSCGNKQQAPQGPPPATSVTTYTVSKKAVTETLNYPGKVTGLREVELRANVNGYITRIFFQEGAVVNKGQKLYEIDRTQYLAAYNSALASVKSAQALLERSKKDLERYQLLDQKQAIAKQRLDYAQTEINTVQAQVDAAKANLSAAKNNLDNSIIYAPFTGTIGISLLKIGSLVTAGSTLLNTVSETNPVAVDIDVDQKELPFFLALEKNASAVKDSIFTTTIPGGQGKILVGKIATIDRAVNPTTGTIKVRVSFPNASGALRIGMNCTLDVRKNSEGEVLVIPYKAVAEQLGEFTVFVVGDSSKVDQRNITLGTKLNSDIVVSKGLKEGEVIVVDGVQNVKNGAVVTTDAPQQPKAQ